VAHMWVGMSVYERADKLVELRACVTAARSVDGRDSEWVGCWDLDWVVK